MIDRFEALKNSLDFLKENIPDFQDSFERLKTKLRNKEFNLVVIGQFKRGKSTFINAFLGAEILPSAVLPLTSVVTLIEYGQHKEAVVLYKDGTSEKIKIDSVFEYVTEKHNPNNKLNVKEVKIFYPSECLKDGLRIIDTPGVGSVFEHNTETTYEYLPNSDAAIFMMSPEPPISQAELDFLRRSKEFIHKFFFVMNKKDLMDNNDLSEVLEFNRRLLEDELAINVDIIPISAKHALSALKENSNEKLSLSNMVYVKEKIINGLKNEKDNILLLSVADNALRIIESLESTYNLQIKTVSMSLETLKTKIELFEDFVNTINRSKDENRFVLNGRVDELITMLDNDIEKLKRDKLKSLIDDTLELFRAKTKEKLKSEELDDIMKENMQLKIQNIFDEFKNQETEIISKRMENIYDEIVQKTNVLIENIAKEASTIFEVDIKPLEAIEKFSEYNKFSFKFKDQLEALAIIGMFIRRKLPSVLGKVVIEKHIIKTTEEIFDRHCGRIRHTFLENIQETTRRFYFELTKRVDDAVLSIDSILQESLKIKKENEEIATNSSKDSIKKLEILNEAKTRIKNIKSV